MLAGRVGADVHSGGAAVRLGVDVISLAVVRHGDDDPATVCSGPDQVGGAGETDMDIAAVDRHIDVAAHAGEIHVAPVTARRHGDAGRHLDDVVDEAVGEGK